MNVVWFNDFDLIDGVVIDPTTGCQVDDVAGTQFFESAEKAISMTGDAKIPWLARLCTSGNSPPPVVQGESICSIKQRRLQADLRNAKHGQGNGRRFHILPVGTNSVRFPKAEIHSGWSDLFPIVVAGWS